ncbi:terpenoid synthase [Boletus edulis BED1]|uniref:Terpene synthase n=1 Tax=Boletus edulis BED1 TaxID=1328754 RepID=A0AAD4BMU6_BOLED|nr:terpenoid synthase [Boletus edulis BED1]
MTMSLQLPDLLSFCSVFELRTSKHCKGVSNASEKWLLESGVALSSMTWSASKPGLLAAACHPTADPTQLRFITDFLSLLLHHREQPVLVSQVASATATTRTPCSEDADTFIMLLSDRLSRAADRHPGWYARFVKSRRCYVNARRLLAKHSAEGALPDLESYVEQRRDASGWRMALEMVQYAGDTHVSDAFLGDALLRQLHDHACDIAAWSEDIVSCAKGLPRKHEANIVTILMRERNVPLECAVSAAGMLVKQSVEAFLATEEALLLVPDFAADHEVRRYLRGVRDWIAGSVNWLYETQLFLGEKGNEVRAFGWVFIPVPP